MAKPSSNAKQKHPRARSDKRNGMTAQERSVADTTAIPSKQAWDPDDASLGFGPRSFDPDRRTEHLSYRDPEEPSQGPLRFDETNYSVERLTLPEGGYNEYADEVGPGDEEDAQLSDQAQRLQYRDTQSELLSDLPPSDISPAYEPDDPDLAFRLTTEDLETSPDGDVDRDAEKLTRYTGQAARRGNRTDELIREDVYEALDSRADIDAPDISLHVRDGVVIIEGEVSDAMVRHRVEQCVDSVDGVKDINNRLHLAAPQPRRPWSDE